MESFLPLPTGRRKSRRSAPAGLTAQFRLQQLEDRTVMSNSIQLSGLGWKPIGPGLILDTTASVPGLTAAGRVNAIAHAPVPFDRANPGYTGPTDPSDPTFSDWNTYFVATPGGGVARTRDGGLNWQFVTDNLPVSSWANSEQNRNLHVGAIAVSPFDRNLVLAGTGGSNGGIFDYAGTGLLISRDGGDTWSLNKGPGNAFNGTAFTKFVFHPKDANVIYAIVDGNDARDGTNFTSAVYRSIDRGQTWQNITVNTGASPFAQITDFILDPVNPNTGFVGIESYGVVRSENLELGTFPTAVYTQPNAINYELRLGGTGTQLAGGSFGQIRLAFGLGTPTQGSRIYALTTGQVVQTATQPLPVGQLGHRLPPARPVPRPRHLDCHAGQPGPGHVCPHAHRRPHRAQPHLHRRRGCRLDPGAHQRRLQPRQHHAELRQPDAPPGPRGRLHQRPGHRVR